MSIPLPLVGPVTEILPVVEGIVELVSVQDAENACPNTLFFRITKAKKIKTKRYTYRPNSDFMPSKACKIKRCFKNRKKDLFWFIVQSVETLAKLQI